MTRPHRPYLAAETAILFPPGGYHWPGMGGELASSAHGRELLERAEAALAGAGVHRGALRRLMAGADQAQRSFDGSSWRWTGDFPLSVAAQTLVGSALAAELQRVHGPPAAVLGESMGEAAAFCASGALELEAAVLLAYHWARALQQASDELGLRMAVVEDLRAEELEPLLRRHQASVVIFESATLQVCALPASELVSLDRSVAPAGGRTLVSNNPCAAHDPRLASRPDAFASYLRFVEGLVLTPPALPLWSAIQPGRLLDSAELLRENLREMSFRPVRWAEAVATVAGRGARNLLQLGAAPSGRYPLRKLCREEPSLQGLRTDTVQTLAAVAALPARSRATGA